MEVSNIKKKTILAICLALKLSQNTSFLIVQLIRKVLPNTIKGSLVYCVLLTLFWGGIFLKAPLQTWLFQNCLILKINKNIIFIILQRFVVELLILAIRFGIKLLVT